MSRPLLLILFTVNCSLATACDRSTSAPTTQPRPAPSATPGAAAAAVDNPLDQAAGLHVNESVTANGDPKQALPLVVALHGLGDRGGSYANLFTGLPVAVRVVALDAPTKYGDGFTWFARGARIEDAGPGIVAAAAQVAEAIRVLRQNRPTRGGTIVTGFSQGGALSYALAARHPDVVGVAIPIGGWLPKDAWPTTFAAKKPAVLGLHGLDDPRIPVDAAREILEHLQANGYNAELVVEPDLAHSVSRKERKKLFERIVEEAAAP